MLNAPADKEALTRKQQELGERFIRRSLVDVRYILATLQVDAVLSQPQTMADLYALAHRLVGTAATLGFHELSDRASELELQLAAITNLVSHHSSEHNVGALHSIAARVLDEINRLACDRAIV
jgi:HPt (histidine-containing phosphotransfer) domain-containing protein